MNVSVTNEVIQQHYRHQFGVDSPHIESLNSAGGFSGAEFWRIADFDEHGAQTLYCLRKWPRSSSIQAESKDESRLNWIHRQLARAHSGGCDFVPVPLPDLDGQTLVSHGQHLWQLEPWMPGQASYRSAPSETRLVAAMQALARFHQAVRTSKCRREPSPGILMRVQRLGELYDGKSLTAQFHQIQSAAADVRQNKEIRDLGSNICQRFAALAPSIQKQLNQSASIDVEIQTIIGDIWHDHVLFTDDQVTGIVDYGAMRMDTPAADLARLLGSLAGESIDLPIAGLNAYQAANTNVSWADNRIIECYDSSTTVISGMNWLQWICVEGRVFGDLQPVVERMKMISRRMDFLTSCL